MTKEKEELSNNTFIRDEKIEPYFIGKDSHCYTVYETITPDTRYTENNVAGKDYTKALGHYSNFGSCLKAIARNKTNDKQNYNSIVEYLETYKQIENKTTTKFKTKELFLSVSYKKPVNTNNKLDFNKTIKRFSKRLLFKITMASRKDYRSISTINARILFK